MKTKGRFILFLALLLGLSFSVKLAVGGGRVSDPSGSTVLKVIEAHSIERGFSSAGQTSIASRPALLLGRGDCLSYIVPVAPQGWHQQTLRMVMTSDQSLWFSFAGHKTFEKQPTWLALAEYYRWKTLSYIGFHANYHPVLGIVTSGQCNMQDPIWSDLSLLTF